MAEWENLHQFVQREYETRSCARFQCITFKKRKRQRIFLISIFYKIFFHLVKTI